MVNVIHKFINKNDDITDSSSFTLFMIPLWIWYSISYYKF